MRIAFVAGLALVVLSVASHSAGIYRCGNTYSNVPCPDGKTVASPATSPTAPEGGSPESEQCLLELKGRLRDPDSMVVGSVSKPRAAMIDYADTKLVVKAYDIKINAKNSYGGYTGMTPHVCYVSQASGKVLRID